jgi:hypothetical protein
VMAGCAQDVNSYCIAGETAYLLKGMMMLMADFARDVH